MRKLLLGFTFASALAMAAEFSGYISDAGCVAKQGAAKTAADSHAGCVSKSCIKRGDKAVLATLKARFTPSRIRIKWSITRAKR